MWIKTWTQPEYKLVLEGLHFWKEYIDVFFEVSDETFTLRKQDFLRCYKNDINGVVETTKFQGFSTTIDKKWMRMTTQQKLFLGWKTDFGLCIKKQINHFIFQFALCTERTQSLQLSWTENFKTVSFFNLTNSRVNEKVFELQFNLSRKPVPDYIVVNKEALKKTWLKNYKKIEGKYGKTNKLGNENF